MCIYIHRCVSIRAFVFITPANGITPSLINGITALHHPLLIARVLRGRGHGHLSPIPHALGKWHNVVDEMGVGTGADVHVHSAIYLASHVEGGYCSGRSLH